MAYTKTPPRRAQSASHWRDRPAQSAPPGGWDVPDAALPIWLTASGDFCIGLPDAVNGRGHSVTIRCDEHAIILLRRLLEARRAAPFARINEPASPTQWLLDAMRAALAGGVEVKRDKLKVEELDDDDLRL